MMDNSSQVLKALIEMRDLLRLMAEPAIAQRDKKLRGALRTIAGSGSKNAKAIRLMNGTRAQATISKECGIDKGQLSGLVKRLNAAELLIGDTKQPCLAISIPADFFEGGE